MEQKGQETLKYWEDVQAGVLGYIREGRARSGTTKLKEESKSKKQVCQRQGSNVRVTETGVAGQGGWRVWRHWVCGKGGQVMGLDAACDRVSGLGRDMQDCVQTDRSGWDS